MVSVARQHCHDDFAAVDDIVQIATMKAINGVDNLKNKNALKGWLLTITVNAARNYFRSERRYVPLDESFEQVAPEPKEFDPRILQLRDEINKLSPKQKQVIDKCVYEDKSIAQIAREIGAPYNTAKANYTHGLKKIKKNLRKQQ